MKQILLFLSMLSILTCYTQTSIESFNSNQSIVMYPNPTNGFINLTISSSSFLPVCEIFDMNGSRIMVDLDVIEIDNKTQAILINMTSVNRGIYIIKININGFIINSKIIKI